MKGSFWHIFRGGWAQTKTGLCSSSDSLVIRKMCDGDHSTFCKLVLNYVPKCVPSTKTDKQLFLWFVMKFFTLFHIITSSISSQIIFITQPFSYTRMSVQISGVGRCYLKLNILFEIIRKHCKNRKTLPWEHLFCCQCVELFY